MLLPSILRILDQQDLQWNVAEAKTKPLKDEERSGLQRIEREIAAAADFAKPSGVAAQTGLPPTGPFLEELLRAINKFEKPDEPRVVDVFE